MTAPTATMGAFQRILTAILGGPETDPALPKPRAAERCLTVDAEVALFVRHLEHVLGLLNGILPTPPPDPNKPPHPTAVAITTLQAVHDSAVVYRDRPFDAPAVGRTYWTRLARRVQQASDTLYYVAPSMIRAAHFAVPTQWLEPTRTRIVARAQGALTLYATAVSDAWQHGDPVDATVVRAARMLAGLPQLIRDQYLSPGLGDAIGKLSPLRDKLFALTGPNPPTTPALYVDIGISHEDPNGTWQRIVDLQGELGRLQGDVQEMTPAQAQTAINALTRKIQAHHVALVGLLADKQIDMILTQYPVDTGTSTALASDRQALDAALDSLHTAFNAGDGTFVRAATDVADFINGSAFTTDFNAAVSQLQNIQWVEQAALSLAIGLAAAVTGGFAAATAEVMIGAVEADVVFGGMTTWAEVGGFAAEAIAFTLVDRAYKQQLFGPEATAGTSFIEDLFWNALFSGATKIVGKGYQAALRDVNAEGWRLRALSVGKAGTEALSVLVLEQLRTLLETGTLPGLGDDGKSLLMQLVTSVPLALAFPMSTSVRGRFGPDLSAAIDQHSSTNLNSAETSAAALATVLDRIRNGTASATERAGLVAQLHSQFGAEIDLIESVPDGTPGKQEQLDAHHKMIADVEFKLAKADLETSARGPDEPSSFAPLKPGVIAADEKSMPIAEQDAADRGGPPQMVDSPALEGAKEAPTPDGQLNTVAPMAAQVHETPAPRELDAQTRLLIKELGIDEASGEPITLDTIVDGFDKGLANLKRRYPTSLPAIVAQAPEGQRLGFLQFLSHDDFAQAQPVFADGTTNFKLLDYKAFALSDQARDFATLYGPILTTDIRRALDAGNATYTKKVLAALDHAQKEIDAAAPDQRANLVAEIGQRTSADWNALIGPKWPEPAKPPPISTADLGIDRATNQWKAQRVHAANHYPTITDPAWLNLLADVGLVLERGRNGDYAHLTEPQRLEVSRQFAILATTDLGTAANPKPILKLGPVNGKVGAFNERMQVPDAIKKVFLDHDEPDDLNVSGTSKPDDFRIIDGTKTATELKATRWWELTDDEAAATVSLYLDHHILDFDNVPVGTRQRLWFAFVPSESQVAAIESVLKRSGLKTDLIRFGAGEWKPLPPPP